MTVDNHLLNVHGGSAGIRPIITLTTRVGEFLITGIPALIKSLYYALLVYLVTHSPRRFGARL